MARSAAPPVHTGWNYISSITTFVIFLLLLGCTLIPFYPKLQSYRAADAEAHRTDAERQQLKRTLEQKTAMLQMVKKDPAFIEIQARDHLDKCREGEVVFQIDTALN